MIRPAVALVLAAAGGLTALPPEWLHNSRERTEAARRALEAKDAAAARAALDEALAHGGEGPDLALRQLNAGHGRLTAGDPAAALAPLEAAAAVPDLAPDAWYGLGNAHLGAQRPGEAVEAYQTALRARPDFAPAKHNLELALQLLEEQQRQEQQEGPEGEGGEPRQQRGDGDGQPSGQPPPGEEPAPQDESNGAGSEASAGTPDRGEPRESPLPQFEAQPDMTAEQAAALLDAVESHEREQRRQQAAEERRRRAARTRVEKDW